MRKIKFILFIVLISFGILSAQSQYAEISSKTGAFSRMGFGARGIGMGNAMSSITKGSLVAFYNPALSTFQNNNSAQIGYSFLSLDRSLNFLSFTRRFKFQKDSSDPVKGAGVSGGIINSGVSNIDSRDANGLSLGDISTSENLFFLSLANRFSEKFAIGVTFRFYYYSLYENVDASSFGIDVGAIYKASNNLSFSLVLTDLNSKYQWDTQPVYQQSGAQTIDKFPLLKKIGATYIFDELALITSVEFESSNAGTNYIRGGAEYNIFEGLYLRAGVDKINLSNTDMPARPSFGFSYNHNTDLLDLSFDYAFVVEPYSSSDQHIIGLSFNF